MYLFNLQCTWFETKDSEWLLLRCCGGVLAMQKAHSPCLHTKILDLIPFFFYFVLSYCIKMAQCRRQHQPKLQQRHASLIFLDRSVVM